MRRTEAVKRVALIAVLATLIAVPTLEANASGRMEFGVALPISATFDFSSFGFGLEAYMRLLGALLVWETAIKTYTSFDALYLRNVVATAGALALSFGHVTGLLPYFGSTYLTAGVAVTLGRVLVAHLAANLAVSLGGGAFYPFLEFRFQFGIDP